MSEQTDDRTRGTGASSDTDRRSMAAQHGLLLRGIVGRLDAEFGEHFTHDTLIHYVEDSYHELSGRAKVLTHIPSFVDRFSRQRLRALAKNQGRIEDRRAEVLFVCQRNDGVSQMAAAMFNEAAESRGHASSAGTAPASHLLDDVVHVMHEIGIDLIGEFPKPLTTEVEQSADVIVTLDAHDDIDVIDDKQYFAWRLPPTHLEGAEGFRELRDDLSTRIDELIAAVLPATPPPSRVALDKALATLASDTVRMGELVVGLGDQLGPALQATDGGPCHAIVEADDEIDELDRQITRGVVEAIARYQPVAGDLRSLLAFHDTALHLERIADGIVDVAATASRDPSAIDTQASATIVEMAALATSMTRDALTALGDRDAELALAVGAANSGFDALEDSLVRLLASSLEAEHGSRQLIETARAGRALERCGEHAVDIAEQALFLVTGESRELGRKPRH